MTKAYLDLVVAYVTLMILLSRVEDRKAVLGLFNTAHEMTHGHSDNSFPRLGQLIVEYDPPLKKLADEFVPHSKVRGHLLNCRSGADTELPWLFPTDVVPGTSFPATSLPSTEPDCR